MLCYSDTVRNIEMRVFNYFKKISGLKKQMKESFDHYTKLMEKGRHIKKTELSNIPDADLEAVAMAWVWGKFNKDWSDQYEIVSSLPKPCQNFYSCRTVSDEINNGGFVQLFFNATGQFAEMSIEGFSAVGSHKLSDVMKQAVELYNRNKQVLESYNDGALKSFLASYDEAIFDELDNAFYNECDDVDYVSYIKTHIKSFGD